jgi:hypothetical protein
VIDICIEGAVVTRNEIIEVLTHQFLGFCTQEKHRLLNLDRRHRLKSFEIERLIRLKVLPKAHREDADALQAAVLTLVYQALDGAG